MPPQQMHCSGFFKTCCQPRLGGDKAGGADRPAVSGDHPYVSIPTAACCHRAHTTLKHTGPPRAALHRCSSHRSPNFQHSLTHCPHPALLRAGKAAPRSPQHHTAQTEISKESPSKSSPCPVSRQVSLPPPQIKGTDVKLMPRLITTKKAKRASNVHSSRAASAAGSR